MTNKKRLIIVIGTPLLAAAVFLFRGALVNFWFPPCPVRTKTGLYCPGCGNTRSVHALLQLDFAAALRNNVTVPFLCLLFLLFYIETAAGLFGRELHLLPRKGAFWYTVLALFGVYFVVRNFIPALQPIAR